MQAAYYDRFKGNIHINDVKDPSPSSGGVIIKVGATGICRSDWYGWQGHDPDIRLPHIPGHELAGEIVEIGKDVTRWKKEDRVTVPFVGGCGKCGECVSGNQQVCDYQFQPGFTAWGSFAEYVAIDYADVNLVKLPESMDYISAASLGCRFVTAFRGLVDVAKLKEGETVAIFGCGGVGLSAIMIAKAFGAQIIAIDISKEKLEMAKKIGAHFVINSSDTNAALSIKELTKGGAHVTVDALGHPQLCIEGIMSLKKRGRHVQIGLLEGEDVKVNIPMDMVISRELKILGSHGMQAHRYPQIFEMMSKGLLDPSMLLTDVVDLQKGVDLLMQMDKYPPLGVAVIDRFV